MNISITGFILSITISFINCANILGIFNLPSTSHYTVGECLLKALANKGHDVTMISPFSSKSVPKNYKELVLTDALHVKDEKVSKMMIQQQNYSFIYKHATSMYYLEAMEDILLNHTVTQSLLNSKEQFDVALVVWFGNDRILALAQRLAKHTIVFSPVGSNHLITKLTKAPAYPSYVANPLPPFPDEMNLVERIQNSFYTLLYSIIMEIYTYRGKILTEKHFPNSPTSNELYRHISLILLNTHYSLESPRPYVPQMIQVGGLHLEEPKQLTGDLKKFMDEAEEGVIFFSLGSNIKSSDLDNEKLRNIVACFSKLPYKVLFKFEKEEIPNLSRNVKIGNWLPQRDLLAHKNMKLFITHGGVLSTIESVHNGVPMIGIPFFGDQEANVNEGVLRGYIVKLSYSDLSEESLTNAINEVMMNSKYRDNIQLRSKIFNDQPLKPIDQAIYWVEYVVRHNGAHHLKTTALKLHWFQEYLIDVMTIVLGTIFVCIYILRKLINYCFKKIRTVFRKQDKKSKVA